MTFKAFEDSFNSARPLRLFMFTLQGITWRFAQADRDIVIGANTWLAAQIDRSEIKQTTEKAKDSVRIRMAYLRDPFAPVGMRPVTQSLGDLWHPYIPSSKVRVMCFATHYGSADAPVLEWSGEVSQPRYNDSELELTCTPGNAKAEARNQGGKFQRACWKTVYSTGVRGCNLDPDDFRISDTLTDVAGLTVKAAAFATAPHSLLQGWLYWTRVDGIVEKRTIVSHVGDTVRLLYGGKDLAIGLAVNALPNCEGTWVACTARRPDPEMHYGGAIYEPIENPMEGVSMSWG